MNITDEKLEQMLRSQAWIEPGADFTDRVMERVAVERVLKPVPAAVPSRRWYERALMVIPAVVFLGFFLQYAHYIGDFAMHRLREVAFWLGSTTGFPLFAAYPILILALIAPLIAGAVASCALTGRCRLTHVLTS